MSHLSDPELVDLLDGNLPAARARHTDGCQACAQRLRSLRDAVAHASSVEVPEPSPLFWEHFSGRVREAVRHTEPAPAFSLTDLLSRASVRWSVAVAFATVFVAAALWRPPSGPESPARFRPESPAADISAESDVLGVSIEQDAAWALVRTVADDVSWDDQAAAGMGTKPGSAERAAVELTADERSELLELLAEETRRSGA